MRKNFSCIITGDNGVTDPGVVERAVNKSKFHIKSIVSLGDTGADRRANEWARKNKKFIVMLRTRWVKKGIVDGVRTNRMAVHYADLMIVIWDGSSKKPIDIIEKAHQRGLNVFIYKFSQTDSTIEEYGNG